MDLELETTFQLVERAQGGDREAMESLFARYLPRVRQIVALRLGYRLKDLEAHEDIVQEGLLKAFQNLDRLEQRSAGSFRNWLSRCVVNAANDYLRRGRADKRGGGKVRAFSSLQSEDMSTIIFAGSDPTPSAVVGQKELQAVVEGAMLGLKEHHREIIILRLFCEMSYEEIGRTLGIEQEATVRKVFSRAMSELRTACGEG